MFTRYAIRCFSRVDDTEVVGDGGFPMFFATRRAARRRLEQLVLEAGPRSIYRYEVGK